eukprot:XP_014770090.1 PREDICTED: mediator of RNA polymerase II transcription subunit 13-like [Octopus bimaculoides]
MSHPSPAGNGCSLEDCYTNLFALTDLCGIKWRKLNADNVSVDPLDDPVLDSYTRCIQSDILCVWRRVLRNSEQRLPDQLAYGKELWIFWYGDKPLSLDTLLSPSLKEIDKGCWDKDKDKDKDNGLSYECRTLLFKALHNLIERCLLTKNFIRLGKWFVQPYDQNSPSDRSSHLSFCFHFFLHGESSVCASIEIKQHPPVWRLTPQHLTLVQESTSPLQVILAPYGLCGTLTGNTYRDTDQASRSVLDEWSRYYPGEVLDAKDAYNENANKLPSVVEVIIAGVHMRYPSAFIFTCEEEPTLTVPASTLAAAPVPPIQRPSCPHPVIPNGPLTPPTSPGEPQLPPGGGLKLCPSLPYATGPVEPSLGPLDQTADSVAFRILEKVAQDSVTMAGISKRNPDLTSEDMLLIWDFGDPTSKASCNCIRHRNSKSKSLAQNATKSLLPCGSNKHVKGEKPEKFDRQQSRHGRNVIPFHRRSLQHDDLFHFELDMIPPMPPNPAFRPPPNSSSSNTAGGPGGVTPGLPQLHNTVEPCGSAGVDSPSTPAPSPLDSETRNQPLGNQNMDPAMPTLSPHPPPQKSGSDKDIGVSGSVGSSSGSGMSTSGGGGNGGNNNSGVGNSTVSSGGGSGGSGGSKPASIGDSQSVMLYNGNDLYLKSEEPSPKMEATPSPANLQLQHHQQQQQQQQQLQQQQQQQQQQHSSSSSSKISK